MNQHRRCLASLILCAFSAPAALANDVSTSFEFFDLSGQFSLGTAPLDVTFTNGEAKTVGILALYNTGLFSWMIKEAETGTITFGVPATSVSFFLRDQSDLVQSVLTVFDVNDVPIATFNGSPVAFTQITVGSPANPIGKITLTNNAPAGLPDYAVIDDLTFCGGALGTNYCMAGANSVGTGALITASGSSLVSDNSFFLTALELPPSVFGIFFFGQNQIQQAFGDGFRCVGGTTFRFPITQASAAGVLAFSPDLTLPNAAGNIISGSTWNFQAWYRDNMGPLMSGFNLSDGVSVSFQ